jgi:hypothetical protein
VQVRQSVVFSRTNRVFLQAFRVVASASTTAAVTTRSARARAARQARREVRRTCRGVQSDRVARTPAQPQCGCDVQPGIAAGQVPAQPEHVVAAARPRRRRARRGRDQPRLPGRRPARRGLPERPGEQRGQRAGEVAPPPLLVREDGGTQRPAVPARRHHGRPAGQHRPQRRPERRCAACAPSGPRRATAATGIRQQQVEQRGHEAACGQGCRGGRRGHERERAGPERRNRPADVRSGRVVHRRHAAADGGRQPG